jgi:hypothetical protein
MKIAILTQPLKHNYGGLLQAFALQAILKKHGHDVITINRQPDLVKVTISAIAKDLLKKYAFNRLLATPNIEKVAYKNTLAFIKENIVLTEEVNSTAETDTLFKQENFDVVIVGSDQTWRPKYSPNIFNYFLDFLSSNKKIKKLAYATSFGTDSWEFTPEQTTQCKELIHHFDAVAVREKSGIDLCQEHFDYLANWVVDPTLLLSAEDYRQSFESFIKTDTRQGMFTYVLDGAPDKKAIIESVATELALPIFTNQAQKVVHKAKTYELDACKLPPVEGWVNAFNIAEFVVTDSFHGCVFAIIFNKPFIAIGNQGRGLARFQSLLSMFGLEQRLITDPQNIGKDAISEITTQSIDWDKVNGIKAKKIQDALEFLTKSLSES